MAKKKSKKTSNPPATCGVHLFARPDPNGPLDFRGREKPLDLRDPEEAAGDTWDATAYRNELIDNGLDQVRRTLAELYIEWRADSFGLSRFFNRVSFMVNRPLIFIAYHKSENPGPDCGLLDDQVLLFDELFRSEMFIALSHAPHSILTYHGPNVEPDERYIKDYRVNLHRVHDYEFQMFSTTSHFFVCAPILRDRIPGLESNVEYVPVHKNCYLGRYFSACFQPFKPGDSRLDIEEAFFTKDLSKHADANEREKAWLQRPEDHPASPWSRQLGIYQRRLERLVEKERDIVGQTILFRSHFEKNIPSHGGLRRHAKNMAGSRLLWNIWTFAKQFVRDETRYDGHYHYNPTLLLGDARRAAIENTLRHVAEHDPSFSNWISFAEDTQWRKDADGNDTANYRQSVWADAERWFKNCLYHDVGHRQYEILEQMAQPVPGSVRFFGENALLSGVTMVTPSVFAKGNIGWLPDSPEKSEEDLNGARWLICLHYLMQFGSPKAVHLNPKTKTPEKQYDLSIVSIPLRAGGAPWCVAARVRSGLVDPHTGLIERPTYRHAFLAYHSMFKALESRLRRKAKREYLRLIFEAARDMAAANLARHRCLQLDRDALMTFNTAADTLCRVFPFRRVELQVPANNYIENIDKLVVATDANPFFDRLKLRPFIEDDEVREAVIGACLQSLGQFHNANRPPSKGKEQKS